MRKNDRPCSEGDGTEWGCAGQNLVPFRVSRQQFLQYATELRVGKTWWADRVNQHSERAEQYGWPARWTGTVRPYGSQHRVPLTRIQDCRQNCRVIVLDASDPCLRRWWEKTRLNEKIYKIRDLKRNLSICITSHRSYLSLVLAGAPCSVLHVPLS